MTWYVARGGGAVAVDASEAYGAVAIGLGELSEPVSPGGELVVATSAVGVSAVVILGELCEAVSTGTGLLVANSAVAGVGDVATDMLFG